MMKPLKLIGNVDERHQLSLQVPEFIAPGEIEVMVMRCETEDEAGQKWESGVAREWAADLTDARQDIYSLTDGEPVDGSW
jgi:hypothetical protein